MKLEQERAEILAKYDKVRENSRHSLTSQIASYTLPRKTVTQQTRTLIQSDNSFHHSSQPAHIMFDVRVFFGKILCNLICDTLLKRCMSAVRKIGPDWSKECSRITEICSRHDVKHLFPSCYVYHLCWEANFYPKFTSGIVSSSMLSRRYTR